MGDAFKADSSADANLSSFAMLAPRDSPKRFRLSSEVAGIPLVTALIFEEEAGSEESEESGLAKDSGLGSSSHMLEL
ncbi:MAG: hypothetical protein CL917_04010 [Deltaproteobacteria bacterium]|nr:hypothetical protein [Deltaproteobacteria bacterium]